MDDFFELMLLMKLLSEVLERLDIEYIAIKRAKK